jgi:hypothetical protein
MGGEARGFGGEKDCTQTTRREESGLRRRMAESSA